MSRVEEEKICEGESVESQLWKLLDSKATTLEVIEDSLTILRVSGGFVEESRIKEKC